MDFKTLEYYRKIYEKRSIRQAAAELYISPQGLSRTLYALEEELQVRLFERSVKGLEPTRAGDYFYQEAEKLLMEEMPVMPLYFRNTQLLVKPSVSGLEKNVLGHTLFVHASK